MIFNFKYLAGIALLAVASCGQGGDPKPQSEVDIKYNQTAYMSLEGEGQYSSSFFDMNIEVPDSWAYASETVAEGVFNLGTDIAAGSDELMKPQLSATMRKSLPIFVISKYEIGTPRADNPSLMSIAENVSYAPGVKNGDDYFDNMKLLTARTGMGINYDDQYTARQIGGRTFSKMGATVQGAGVSVQQSYHALRDSDYVIVIIGTFSNEAEELELNSLLDSVTFN